MNLTESNLLSLLNRPVSAYGRRIPSFGASDVIWLTLVLIAFGWAFFLSYQRWLDPIADSGRDLYIPEEILKGKKLYRDLLYVFPPLTPYAPGQGVIPSRLRCRISLEKDISGIKGEARVKHE